MLSEIFEELRNSSKLTGKCWWSDGDCQVTSHVNDRCKENPNPKHALIFLALESWLDTYIFIYIHIQIASGGSLLEGDQVDPARIRENPLLSDTAD